MEETEKTALAARTSMKIGGPADRMVMVENMDELGQFVSAEKKYFVLGGGTNILVGDLGVREPVLILGDGFRNHEVVAGAGGKIILRVGAAVNLSWLAMRMGKQGYSGIEFGFGIPGTVGGAVVMNAGIGTREMKDALVSVTYFTPAGGTVTKSVSEIGFGYRRSDFPAGAVIVAAEFAVRKSDPGLVMTNMKTLFAERKRKQPWNMPSAGSVFKNPPQGDSAGKLIEMAGLKGYTIGGAQVSTKHANFIVNTGNARASDVKRLIEHIERKVAERFGVRLEREIKLVGEFLE